MKKPSHKVLQELKQRNIERESGRLFFEIVLVVLIILIYAIATS